VPPARLVLGLYLLLAVGSRAWAQTEMDLRNCQKQLAANPSAEDGPKCFYETARRPGQGAAAERKLKDLTKRYPQLPWLYFYLGNVRWDDPASAEVLYRRAAALFEAHGKRAQEAHARLNIYEELNNRQQAEEAALELRRAKRAAEASGDRPFLAEVAAAEAKRLRDLAQAKRMLETIEPWVSVPGHDSSRGEWLFAAGSLNRAIGHRDEARKWFLQLSDLAARQHDPYHGAAAQYGLLEVALDAFAEMPEHVQPAEIRRIAESSVTAYGKAPDALYPQWVLGLLTQGQRSDDYFASCLAAASSDEDKKSYCLSGQARHLAETDPAQAESKIEEAGAAMGKGAGDAFRPYYWGARMRVSWRTRTPAEFWRDGQEAIQQIERLRQEQGTASRAGSFSTWSDDYYWLAGRLLQPQGGGEGEIEHAFAVAEHLRARTLLEALAGAGAEPQSPEQLADRRRNILLASDEVRRRAADRNVPTRERRYAQEDLAELARQRAEVEQQLRHSAPAPLAQPFSSLPEVRAALAPDEALLSFQVAPWKDWTGAFGGGSWLTVVTQGTPPHAYHLPGREDLRDRVSQLLTPLESDSQDLQQDRKCVDLYDQLLASALHGLPAGVRRLIIVPDDDLHRLPWAALRAKAGEKRLAELYEISIVPSSSLLLKWRRERPKPASVPALVIAAPGVGLPLGRAREEGETIVRNLPRSRLLTGPDASEAFVKHARLSDYGILHLAAHSVIDLDNPELSAVRLSPGKGEDGQLRFSEILGLRLDGRLVVLSSCETASGQILRGEGPLSLARAFFQARAHAVVASLWPIEDADAEALFERFYRHLGARESVASALRAAQRELIAEGAPAARWAGFEVIGDGNLLPVGAPKRPATPPR